MTALSFSVSRGGDWVDQNTSADTGVPVAKVTATKENSTTLDLTKSQMSNIYEEDSSEANVLIAPGTRVSGNRTNVHDSE